MNPSNPLQERVRPSPYLGFRFHPTDEEIISYYLLHKMKGEDSFVDHIVREIDLCQCDPCDLPDLSLISSNDQFWHFFHRLDYKYLNSKRANRTTRTGFWKATGKIRSIKAKETGEEIGTKRTLVFYYKIPDSKPVRTNWVIHEFQSKNILPDQRAFVFCRLKCKADEKTDNSRHDEGEPSRPVEADVEKHAAQTDAVQSHVHVTGVDFNHPSSLQSQTHLEQGTSDEHLSLTNFSDNQLIGLNSHDTSEDIVDPITLADSFLSLDECFSEKNALILPDVYTSPNEGYVEDSNYLETEAGHGESFQCLKLYGGGANSKEYQHMPTAEGPTDTLAFERRKGNLYCENVSVNHIELVGGEFTRIFKPTTHKGKTKQEVSPRRLDKISGTDKPSQEMEICYMARGEAQSSFAETNRIELIGEEFPRLLEPLRQRITGNLSGQDMLRLQCNSVLKNEGRNLSCRYKTHNQPAKPNLSLRSTGSTSNDSEVSFICSETTPSIHRPTSPSVYIVNILIGLVLFIFIVKEMLILH